MLSVDGRICREMRRNFIYNAFVCLDLFHRMPFKVNDEECKDIIFLVVTINAVCMFGLIKVHEHLQADESHFFLRKGRQPCI
jgi:hypothetical protein